MTKGGASSGMAMVQPHIYAKNILICYYILSKKALTSVLSSLPSWTATVLEDFFEEYYSSSAALGQQHPEITNQPFVCDWWATSKALLMLNCRFIEIVREVWVEGEYNNSRITWLDYLCVVTATICSKHRK